MLSPVRAATLLGVSESTLKRWVDSGHIRAEKTEGGHRRIPVGEILAFMRARGRPAPSLEALGLLAKSRRARVGAPALSAESLADLLLAGDVEVVRRMLLDAFASGRPVDDLCDGVVAPSMARIGERWVSGEIEVYQEHLASQRLWTLLIEIGRLLPAPADTAPLAIGGSPEGDPYLLPSLTAELALREIGWRVLNLGPETPMTSMAAAVQAHRPRLVWVSITTQHPAPAFLASYNRVVAAVRAQRAGLIVGGQGLTPELQKTLVAAAFGTRLAHLREFARTLAP